MADLKFIKHLQAAKTMLEMAKDRGFPVTSTYINPDIFKQKYDEFKSASTGGAKDVVMHNEDILDYVLRHPMTNRRLIMCFFDVPTSGGRILRQLEHKIAKVINEYHVTKRDDVIIVYDDELYDHDDIQYLEKNNLRICRLSSLQYNVSRHMFVPKHQSISIFEHKRVLKYYRCKEEHLPSLNFSDPQAIYHGFKVGAIVKITRHKSHVGKSISYRCVTSDVVLKNEYAVSEFVETEDEYNEPMDILNLANVEQSKHESFKYIQDLKYEENGTEKLEFMFHKILGKYVTKRDVQKTLKIDNDPEIYYEFHKILPNLEDNYSSSTSGDVIAKFLKENYKSFPKGVDKYLDFGCADGSKTIFMGQALGAKEIHGVDTEDFDGHIHRKEGFHLKLYSKNDPLPYEDNTFDVVSAFHVLHHIEDNIESLEEIRRVLKPDGILIIREHDINNEFDNKLVVIEHYIYVLCMKEHFSLKNLNGYYSKLENRDSFTNKLESLGFKSEFFNKSQSSSNYNHSYYEIFKLNKTGNTNDSDSDSDSEGDKSSEDVDMKENVRQLLTTLSKEELQSISTKKFRQLYKEKYMNEEDEITREMKDKIKQYLQEVFMEQQNKLEHQELEEEEDADGEMGETEEDYDDVPVSPERFKQGDAEIDTYNNYYTKQEADKIFDELSKLPLKTRMSVCLERNKCHVK